VEGGRLEGESRGGRGEKARTREEGGRGREEYVRRQGTFSGHVYP
jgi:hypothetical protein